MRYATVERFGYGPAGTFGVLTVSEGPRDLTVPPLFQCMTLERPDWPFNAQRNLPCYGAIPAGTYTILLGVFRRNTPDPSDDYPAYEVQEVPGRSLIKIHKGNTIRDIKGCILLGDRIGMLRDLPAVLASSVTFGRFMAAMGGAKEARLVVDDLLVEE